MTQRQRARARAQAVVRDWLAQAQAADPGVEAADGVRDGENVVVLPGEAKLKTTVSILVGERALSVSAFVVRRPDENHEAFYRWLLERNLRLPGVSFGLDRLGDVYLTGRLPLEAVSTAAVDDLLGAVLATADGCFNELLALGFLSSIRREWRWRVSRGEPTRNLEAFRHLLEPGGSVTAMPSSPPVDSRAQHTLVLLRHGQSTWNAKNLFTGWVDVPLSEQGVAEAVRGGHLLAERAILPDVVHTSLLRRAITTANLALDACDRHWIPVRRSWRLNERHYGGLQGRDKKQTLATYGEEQFMLWRRSYDVPPPAIAADDEFSQAGEARYAGLGPDLPAAECLADVVARMLPYWESDVVPDLRAGHVVLLAAHGNSLRALVKHLDGIGDEEIVGLNIPTGIPLVYRLDAALRPVRPGGEYLDPEAAATAVAAVAAQGR